MMDVVVVGTALTLIVSRNGMTGASAGFLLSFASTITTEINWALIHLRTFELKGVSLERTSEYCNLPVEAGEILNPIAHRVRPEDQILLPPVDTNWPTDGSIKVQNLKARYGPDMPDILHGVTFQVSGGERVGIVGSTGGGKSTLAKAFFNFVEITQGKIKIDELGKSGMDRC
jgi:ABC-type multidrug transport system fused ATPase/permease subunit